MRASDAKPVRGLAMQGFGVDWSRVDRREAVVMAAAERDSML
jgi:hypothetical protein